MYLIMVTLYNALVVMGNKLGGTIFIHCTAQRHSSNKTR